MSNARNLANLLNASGLVPDPKLVDLSASKLLGRVPAANAPLGSVLQVVSATTSTQVSISGTTYTDSGLSASITPTSATSKILVLVNQNTYHFGSSTNIVASGVRLLRNSTAILEPYSDGTGPLEPYIEVIGASQLYNSFRHNINFLDSPATTSSVTYKTQGRLRSSGGGQVLTFQTSNTINGTSTIILMEIAA